MSIASLKKTFKQFLSKNKHKRFVVSPHMRADIDAISSAYAVASLFPNSIIAVPDELNESATNLAEHLGIKWKVLKDLDKSKFDGMIVCDTSAYGLIKDAREWNVVLIIDHHRAEGRDMSAPTMVIDEKSPSCAELVAHITPKVTDKKIAFALCCGIVSDTARFKSGRTETFTLLGKLLTIADTTYQEVLLFSEPERNTDSKIAVLKAFSRAKYQAVSNYIVATTEVSSSEGDAAAAISEVADVAFVASFREEDNECRVSARARKQVHVPLHEVMKSVAVQLGGNGGGHAKAAGAAIPKGNPDHVLKRCVEVFMDKL